MKHLVVTSMPQGDIATRWNEFLPKTRFATHYLTPNYFIDPYVRGERFAVLAIDKDGDVAAVATGVRSPGLITSGMFSRPQVLFRARVNRPRAVAALVAGLDELGADSTTTEVHTWEPLEFNVHGMRVRRSGDDTSIVMLDLAKGADAIFAGFSQTRRNEIRRAENKKLVEIKELETFVELEELYRIHCDWNERKGNPSGTFEQMQTAVGQSSANRRVFIAKVDGKTIAGSFYRFCPGGVVEHAANFSLPEHQRLRPNDLIGWYAIKWACDNGFSHFSMDGAHLFLRRCGGEIMTTFRYRRDASLFRLYDLRKNAREIGIGALQLLPTNLRNGMLRMFAR